MSKVYNDYYFGIDNIKDVVIDAIEIDSSLLKGQSIFFRPKEADSKEIIKIDNSKEITVITYEVGSGFSNSILYLVKHSNKNIKLKIAFNYGYVMPYSKESAEDRDKRHDTKVNKIIYGFQEIFDLNSNLTIDILVAESNHIKLLQCDDCLFLGSMNFSKTANSIKDSIIKDHPLDLRNHELVCSYSQGGKSVSTQVWSLIESSSKAKSFKVNKENYQSLIRSTCDLIPPPQLCEDKIKKNLKDEVSKCVILMFEEIFDHERFSSFSRDNHEAINNLLSSIINIDSDEVVENFIKNASFLIDEIPFKEIKELSLIWKKNVDQNLDEEELIDEEKIRTDIYDKRKDGFQDNGENGLIWSNNSEDSFVKKIEDKVTLLSNSFERFTESLIEDYVMWALSKTLWR